MMSEKTGIVYLIGAGPGDPGLITVKGKRLLDSCDAVVYDNLVCPQLIVALPRDRDIYYVGKKAGVHPVPQEKINEMLLRLAREGKNVARLKGSDPLIFGRGGEEAKYLRENGIRFEIVTGVTSGIAGPAYAGIPCTDRERASFVMFVTGHKANDKLKSSVPWDWVAKAKNGTIVVYMGVGQIESIVTRLTEAGMSPDLPAAIVERGTFPSQRVFTTTLTGLAATAIENKVQPPALFVLGHVVELRPWLEWLKDLPLLGLRVMVTRAVDQAFGLYRRLRELGAEPLPYPTIAIEACDDDAGWQTFASVDAADAWMIFTSENGVRHFFAKFAENGHDIRRLAGFKIAAIGEGTARELAAMHLTADFIPGRATVRDLAAELTAAVDLNGATVVRIRGNLAEAHLEDTLPGHGARVIPLTVYRTYHPTWPDGLKEKLLEYPPQAILFTSGSTMEGLYHNLSQEEVDRVIADAKVFSIGPRATETLHGHGVDICREAPVHTIDGLLCELLDVFKK